MRKLIAIKANPDQLSTLLGLPLALALLHEVLAALAAA
jgi:hypothetical protein